MWERRRLNEHLRSTAESLPALWRAENDHACEKSKKADSKRPLQTLNEEADFDLPSHQRSLNAAVL